MLCMYLCLLVPIETLLKNFQGVLSLNCVQNCDNRKPFILKEISKVQLPLNGLKAILKRMWEYFTHVDILIENYLQLFEEFARYAVRMVFLEGLLGQNI